MATMTDCCSTLADAACQLCPWFPLSHSAKMERAEAARRKEQIDRVVEENTNITKQDTDHCHYKHLLLKNGIKVLLIQDTKASTSACSLEIKLGNFSDPPHLEGLAHLLEHTIFAGSELFPAESFSAFLSSRGGSSNAFTASSHTNFHFDVPKEHFLDALDRFVSFFICPVFHEKTVESEVEIIQSEHEKNKHVDLWRINQVEKSTANPRHPFSRFSTGTRRTLSVDAKSGRNLKYEVYNFYKLHYSANLMAVCLLHNADLEKLQEIAVEKLIMIPNKNVPKTLYRTPVFRPDQMGVKILVVPVREVYHLNLTFPLADYDQHYRACPGGFIAQLIGYKGQGGLFSFLRKRGFAHHLVASHKKFAFCQFSLLLVNVQLTDLGERHVDAIITNVFQFINLLKNSKADQLKPLFDQLAFISKQHFEMKEPEKAIFLVQSLAQALHVYTPEDVLCGDYVIQEWQPDLVQRILKDLHPNNLRITVLTKNAK